MLSKQVITYLNNNIECIISDFYLADSNIICTFAVKSCNAFHTTKNHKVIFDVSYGLRLRFRLSYPNIETIKTILV